MRGNVKGEIFRLGVAATWFPELPTLSTVCSCTGVCSNIKSRRTARLYIRGHMRTLESRFGVAAELWSPAANDGVLEVFTQSHPRVPEECQTPVR